MVKVGLRHCVVQVCQRGFESFIQVIRHAEIVQGSATFREQGKAEAKDLTALHDRRHSIPHRAGVQDPPPTRPVSSSGVQRRSGPVDDPYVALVPVTTPINIPMTTNDRLTQKLKLRENLINEIVADLEQDVNSALADAPASLTDDDRKAIRDELIAEAKIVLDALETRQLEDEGARQWYACGVPANVRHLVNVRVAQKKR